VSVLITPARGKKPGWEFDIRLRWPEGGRDRVRGRCPLPSKDAAKRWAEAKERALYAEGREAFRVAPPTPAQITQVPTLGEFWPRVVSDHYLAERKKASALDGAESIYRNHLADRFGSTKLDEITTADVAGLKGALSGAAPKTVNNILSVLSRALRCAVAWDVIRVVPCKFGLLKVPDREMPFYELDEYQRLKTAAQRDCHEALLSVLLAGSAGLRRGEIRALRWTDVDFTRRTLRVAKALWRNVESEPKGWRARVVPLTGELCDALKKHRHLCEFVLDGATNRRVRTWLSRAQARAGLSDKGDKGGIHILRHTFCSHLAMAGVAAKAIQELAGHADLKTTMRYMHLSPANRTSAIATLERFTEGVRIPARSHYTGMTRTAHVRRPS
jgi:integrase